MASRQELQTLLETLLESDNVYYRSPESKKMEYPAIRFIKKTIKSMFANNATYSMMDCYEVTVSSRTPDHPVIKKILSLPYASYDRYYVAENLNHDVCILYF